MPSSVSTTAPASPPLAATNWSGSSGTAWTTIDVPVLADTVAPTVSSITPTVTPTNASGMTFLVTFSESVSGVAAGNFNLTTSGVSGASILGVTGSGNTRTVTVNTGSGDGTIRLDLSSAAPAINDIAGNALTATYNSGTILTVNKSVPTVSSIAPASSPTNAASTTFLVTFNEAVSGVAASNLSLNTSGVSGASITGVTGSGGTRTVTVSTGSGSGTIRLDLSSTTPAITDVAANALTATYSGGTVLTVDKTAPTVTINQAAGQTDPAYANPIHFTVVFSEAVSGFASNDITIGGTAGGSKTATISGTGPTYDVAISGVTTPGTVTASVAASRVIDAAGNNNAASTSSDNSVTYASGISVTGASVLSSTQVKITFSSTVDASAASMANYVVSPGLSVSAAVRSDVNHTVILTTSEQVNGTPYAVTVSGITGLAPALQTAYFIGTPKPVNSLVSFQDDFNRGSGLLSIDAPIPGPWTNEVLTPTGAVDIEGTTTLNGSGALSSHVPWIDANNDNANLQYAIDGSEFWASTYIYVPASQGWAAGQEVGLIRLNQTDQVAQARLTAFYESASAFTIKVNWKEPGGAYHGDVLVTTGVTFGAWHWIQLHVKNGAAGVGEIQAFVDGHLDFQQNTTAVQNQPITFLEAGIMHMTSVGPAATTITDQIRLGQSYQLPSVIADTTAPTSVTLTAPTSGSTISGGTASLAATAADDYSVQRVEFLIDGAVVGGDDCAPFAQTVDVTAYDTGAHTFAVRAYDTSGNFTTSSNTSATIDNSGPTIISPAVAPSTFSPNADGYQDTATITYSTAATCEHKVDVLNASDVAVKTFGLYTSHPAGDFTVIWNGKDDSAVPVPDGHYTVRIRTRDGLGRVTTATVPVTVDRVLDFTLRTPATISPNGDTFFDTTAISYHLNGSATVTVAVEDLAGAVVRTVQAATPQTVGDYSGILWDGKNDSNVVVPDGQYTIRITAVSALGSTDVNTRYLTTPRLVTVDTTQPTITLDSITPQSWEPAGGVLTVTFTPSEAGDAIVKIFTGTGSTGAIKTIDQSVTAAGQTSVTWDGMTDAGPMVSPGTYTARVYYADKVANKATVYPVSAQFTVGGVTSIAVTSPTAGSSYAQVLGFARYVDARLRGLDRPVRHLGCELSRWVLRWRHRGRRRQRQLHAPSRRSPHLPAQAMWPASTTALLPPCRGRSTDRAQARLR